VIELHWSLQQIDELFADAVDYKGLEYWYNTIAELNKRIKNK
jgi:hypothetical protein